MKRLTKLFRTKSTHFSVFKGFLVTYLVIILVLSITCGITYWKLFQTIDNYESKNMDSLLEQSNKVLAQYMDEINNLPSQLLSNRAVSSFLSNDLFNRDSEFYSPTSSSEIVSILNNYTQTNLLLDNILLYSPYSDKLIMSSASFNGPTGYGPLLSLENLTYEGMKHTLLEEYSHRKLVPAMKVWLNGIETTDILHITSLSIYDHPNESIMRTGSCVTFINSERLISLLQQSYGDTPAYLYLYNAENKLLAKTAEAPDTSFDMFADAERQTLAGDQYLTRTTHNSNSWNLAIAIPYHHTLQHSLYLKWVLLTVLLLSVFACLVLAFAFAKFNYRPVHRIAQKLTPRDGDVSDRNEFDTISSAIESLLDNEQTMHNAFEQNLPILHMNFVQTLFTGELSSQQEIDKAAHKLRLDVHGTSFAPLLVYANPAVESSSDTDQFEQINLAKTVIVQSFSGSVRCLHCDLASNGVALLLCFDSDVSNDNLLLIEETIQKVSDSLFASHGLHLICAVGDFCQSLTDLFYSYERAKDCLANGLQTTLRHNTWCTPNTTGFSWYYYPFEVENKLIHTFQSGNLEGVYEILNAVYEENENNRILSGNMISCLYSDIKNTIYKLLDEATLLDLPESISSLLPLLNTVTPMSDFFQLVRDVFAVMDEYKNQREGADLSAKILRYVDREALSPGFGRHSFAEHFYISEDYVSKYFKENTGYHFLEYVTKVKMTTAQKMLQSGNYTIEKIAEAVGYNSSIAFRRAFKAYTGLTPSEWRQQNIR